MPQALHPRLAATLAPGAGEQDSSVRLENLTFRGGPAGAAPEEAARLNSQSRQTLLDAPRPEPARPIVKWAGGKGQLLAAYRSLFPQPGKAARYFEPFLGGGAVFFYLYSEGWLSGRTSFLNDYNSELITTYRVVQHRLPELLQLLEQHRLAHMADEERVRRQEIERGDHYYYQVRADRPPADPQACEVWTAARLLYLNKTCYNGLYRVNRRGEFNVPLGSYRAPKILDAANLRSAAVALQDARLLVGDFAAACAGAGAGDFVYFDPPYEPLSATASFTDYTDRSFSSAEQVRLRDLVLDLNRRGARVMLSNSTAVRDLYAPYADAGIRIEIVSANRTINSRGDRRGQIDELVVLNYPPGT